MIPSRVYPSRIAAITTEIVEPLEARDMFVTPADVEPIAVRALMPASGGQCSLQRFGGLAA